MDKGLDMLTFLEKAETVPVIDGRTPCEYAQGHIPGAFNLPLFSDEERKKVGKTYKKSGRQDAVFEGLEYAGPKIKYLAGQAREISVNRQLLVHCWRGGMRSASMAWLFRTMDIESFILDGGYKSYRRHVLDSLETDFPFVVIGGFTGSGKTNVLRSLEEMGGQIVNLEELACHKGSAFGGIGQAVQPSNEQFENNIYTQLMNYDLKRTIWIEDESRTIGKNTLPAGIHRNIRTAPVIFLEVPHQKRIERLVHDYAGFSRKDLADAIDRIRPRLGDLNAREAIQGIMEGNFMGTAELVLRYYDKTYRFGLGKREQDRVFRLSVSGSDDGREIAEKILVFAEKNLGVE
jgi:tRNA 2-selenouridine synthase